MFKKRTAILFLYLAYALLLGHNIIPHHHHHHEHLPGHHTTHHHHDKDADSHGLKHLFAFFVHAADGFTFTTTQHSQFIKHYCGVAILNNNFSLDEFLIRPLLDKPPEELLIIISPHTHPSGLRAPPAPFI